MEEVRIGNLGANEKLRATGRSKRSRKSNSAFFPPPPWLCPVERVIPHYVTDLKISVQSLAPPSGAAVGTKISIEWDRRDRTYRPADVAEWHNREEP